MSTRNAGGGAAPSRLGIWWDHHLHSIVYSLGRAMRKPWATLLTMAVMALALALPLGLSIALDNLKQFAGNVQQSRDINVFLKTGVDAAAANALATTLRGHADVAAVALRTPEQGMAELRDSAGLGEALDALDDNPLPTLLIVTPAAAEDAPLAAALSALPQADLVQHDALWRKRLDGWLRFGERLVQVLSVLLGAGAVLVVGNTVRLDIQSRREEIGVLQLLGASDGFIRRPFLYLGAWYGFGAGVLALGLIAASGLALGPPLAELADSYGSHFALHGLDALHSALVLLGTLLLGWLGAWLVTGHFLRQTRPTDT
ncbi:permease-like cell division protein FtsX [Xanthomonas graminis]|jgi:cell division transport system permease protein|uniref:Cell division protein FtsX n=1 Tax=Xanthomonas graminis pv. graminis TaxID=134874 RepID=A0A1M4INC9_9XANT|nr:permease-like cell division protein FtsX [Xanthomonas translucens]EKU24250.1 Cell division protein FtsX [Xanthomonas translucens pv. graminis ART-Xtg29]OAX63240.1 cell division protein FtsX [Xanthomonas translucens pv. graminis]UKE54989.1 permease-like cell division protein FtsX [Xanthomonas translucens pv. graminis]WIH09357.1 permease-like cell division protein FtsX [Xanthomonas translucens pv. graminis]WIH12666.1 permease-like cell division protein FtsX [Xanthomonas translucens pv. gramin